MAFTRCPKCDGKTKQKKLPLVIHLEPPTLVVLNKTCRYCPFCELLIIRQSEIEPMLAAMVAERRPEAGLGDYTLLGTLDRADWRAGDKGQLSSQQVASRLHLFKDQWQFEVRGGWGVAEQ